jgi:hypothetical protein
LFFKVTKKKMRRVASQVGVDGDLLRCGQRMCAAQAEIEKSIFVDSVKSSSDDDRFRNLGKKLIGFQNRCYKISAAFLKSYCVLVSS